MLIDLMLDPRVRPTLARAGIDVQQWNDGQLKAIEYTAEAVRDGERVFVPDEMAPLVAALVQPQRTPRKLRCVIRASRSTSTR